VELREWETGRRRDRGTGRKVETVFNLQICAKL